MKAQPVGARVYQQHHVEQVGSAGSAAPSCAPTARDDALKTIQSSRCTARFSLPGQVLFEVGMARQSSAVEGR